MPPLRLTLSTPCGYRNKDIASAFGKPSLARASRQSKRHAKVKSIAGRGTSGCWSAEQRWGDGGVRGGLLEVELLEVNLKDAEELAR